MKIIIGRIDNENIYTEKDYSDIKDKGEVSHIVCELELIKQDLINIFDTWDEEHID